MRRIFIVASLAMGSLAFAQAGKVGINEAAPEATLDIKPNTDNAAETARTNEGILIPRLTKTRVGNTDLANRREGTLVYVTDDVLATDNATFTGTGKGFYYYDATAARWVKIGAGAAAAADNLYTANGTLTSARTVTQNDQNLTFKTGTNGQMIVDGTYKGTGAVYQKAVRVTAVGNYTVVASDYLVNIANGAAETIVILPNPADHVGRQLYFVNENNQNVVFQYPVGTQALSGTLAPSISVAGAGMILISDGQRWFNFIGQ